MKTRYLILILCFLSVLSSCEKPSVGIVMRKYADITFVNKQSQNLLTPPTSITKDDIRLYYAFNGVTSPSIIPKGFEFLSSNGAEQLRVMLNVTFDEKYPVTILKIGNYAPDTLTCEIAKSNPYSAIAKIWYNSVLVFDSTRDKNGQNFTIVK